MVIISVFVISTKMKEDLVIYYYTVKLTEHFNEHKYFRDTSSSSSTTAGELPLDGSSSSFSSFDKSLTGKRFKSNVKEIMTVKDHRASNPCDIELMN